MYYYLLTILNKKQQHLQKSKVIVRILSTTDEEYANCYCCYRRCYYSSTMCYWVHFGRGSRAVWAPGQLMIGLQELLGAVMWGMTVFDDGKKNVVVVPQLLCVCVCVCVFFNSNQVDHFAFSPKIIKISRVFFVWLLVVVVIIMPPLDRHVILFCRVYTTTYYNNIDEKATAFAKIKSISTDTVNY